MTADLEWSCPVVTIWCFDILLSFFRGAVCSIHGIVWSCNVELSYWVESSPSVWSLLMVQGICNASSSCLSHCERRDDLEWIHSFLLNIYAGDADSNSWVASMVAWVEHFLLPGWEVSDTVTSILLSWFVTGELQVDMCHKCIWIIPYLYFDCLKVGKNLRANWWYQIEPRKGWFVVEVAPMVQI